MRCGLLAAAALLAALAPAATACAGDGVLDLEEWHRARPFLRPSEIGDSSWRWSIGLYPEVDAVLGLPQGAAVAPGVNLSIARAGHFSVFAGYGREVGPDALAELWTLGWGGVQVLQGARPQRGFFGAFLRYRRWDVDDHGIHHGISVGTTSAVGPVGLGFELGGARSERNHWLAVAQVKVVLGLPVSWRW